MKISRRHVLKGLGGTALALPLLESFLPRRAQAQVADQSYAFFLRQANGVGCAQTTGEIGAEPERFWPTQPGTLSAATMNGRAVDELLAYAPRLLLIGDVNMKDYNYGDGHARGAMQGLTGRGPTVDGAAGSSEAAGESLDHRIGTELNTGGRESLVLYAGKDGGWLGGACISYRGAGMRRGAFNNPKGAYASIATSSGLSPLQAQQMVDRQLSVNDLVREQMQRLLGMPRLSQADRDRLDLHFSSIRDLELQLSCQLSDAEVALFDGAEAFYDSVDGNDVWATARLHIDIAVMAIACGQTRSVSLQIGNGNDGNNRYRDPDTGQMMENYHYISHRRLSHDSTGAIIPGSDLLHHKVDRQFGQIFKYLLDKLDAYGMPDGKTLLDHGISVWYNDNANGPAHSNMNTPVIVAGSANGFLKQGQYIELGTSAITHRQVLNTLGAAVGLKNASGDPIDDFGDPGNPGGLRSELLA